MGTVLKLSDITPTGAALKLSDTAIKVLNERYLWRDECGNIIETPIQMFRRVAKCVASVEKIGDRGFWEDRFFEMMTELVFLPNSPTLMNAGKEGTHGQLSACYVLDIGDNMSDIFETLKKQAMIHKTGGGTGFNFSALRPAGSRVNTTNGVASGPVSFMELFNLATDVIQQGGMRRGANMGVLNCDHPDILKFIQAKTEEGRLKNFNISVAITDTFMLQVLAGIKEANTLFNAIVDNAWRSGDPGLIFIDTINNKNSTPWLGPLKATNPCGETPLYGNEACNLGSLNLSRMVSVDGAFDYKKLNDTVRKAVRFLDNVIDVNHYPLPEIREAVLRTRKIGLGVMGWAECLYKMRIPYDSEEAIKLAHDIMGRIQQVGHEASKRFAETRGPNNCGTVSRNSDITCIAPTGTISLIAGCSSGIEPVFALQHKRIAFAEDGKDGQVFEYSNPIYAKALSDGTFTPEEIKKVFVTAHDIAPAWHVEMQAAFQRHTDLAVSKTVNLPETATRHDIYNIYILAWQLGCKGITVYRDNCKSTQVLYHSTIDVDHTEADAEMCPECGGALIHKEGCKECTSCHWSPCSV